MDEDGLSSMRSVAYMSFFKQTVLVFTLMSDCFGSIFYWMQRISSSTHDIKSSSSSSCFLFEIP